jgi:hypothetical protein
MYSTKPINKTTINKVSLAERRGIKVKKFNLPNTTEKENTSIEHIKPPFTV